jgi:hypothetical protein
MDLRYVLPLIVLLLGACGPSRQQLRDQQQQRDLIQRYRAEDVATLRACASTYPTAERSAANAVPFAKCMIEATSRLHYALDDLGVALNYRRLELAEQLAGGRITVAGYQSQFSQYVAEVNTQRQFRKNQAQMARAAQNQANAAACMAARQKTANDNAEADAQTAANQGNNSPAAGLAALAARSLSIMDEIQENKVCNQ